MQNLFRRILFHYWYFRQPPWDTGVSPPELLQFMQEHEPGRAIDIGCGTGTNVITLARAGWKVTGVDFAPRAIKLARQKARQAGVPVELSVRDATRLDGVEGPFDLALDLGCFHTISQAGRRKYLEGLQRILAPNGFWLMYGFLRSDAQLAGPGLGEADLSRISAQLTLRSRQDGFDDKRSGPVDKRSTPRSGSVDKGGSTSAWFLFQKREQAQA
ncbi:MAG: class I SAM-dependent methyltransferase [Chloroflexi bacterium]|nr:MAG: class I SAM-dependent methyltransferase [Chloroflexota bacterium]